MVTASKTVSKLSVIKSAFLVTNRLVTGCKPKKFANILDRTVCFAVYYIIARLYKRSDSDEKNIPA